MGKVYTRFQTKKAQKPYPLGVVHTYQGVPPVARTSHWLQSGKLSYLLNGDIYIIYGCVSRLLKRKT